ncbi:MAG: thiamine phosphate synthase [Desulfatiglans sp.]|jgi:thiamine-phosphate pyrophosphorylase|nr:thiamine phosphate synthase [Thermodesulfobacteriota bacterium]MEE4352179.1 thiamine phosphate synthase [Desulfatiglans sp.]
METRIIDYSLYLVTDRTLSRQRSLESIVEAAVRGGVTCVQLREKDCDTRDFIEQALSIHGFLKRKKIPMIINDRIDVAMAVKAEGVHLGQSDMPLAMARSIVKDSMLIGISAESFEDAVEAEKGGADYIGVSPIFATPTKTDTAEPLGLAGLRRIRQAVKIPLVGIGGLNIENASDIMRCGGDGVAVVSAIVSADDPEEAARALKHVVSKAGNP